MKKNFIVLWVVVPLGVAAAVVGFVLLAAEGAKLDEQSKSYADEAIRAVISSWDKNELTRRASAELRNTISKEDADKLFATFKRLGNLQKYHGSDGEAHISVMVPQGISVTAVYVGRATFSAGPAQIKVTLIKRNDQWKIVGFNVASEAPVE